MKERKKITHEELIEHAKARGFTVIRGGINGWKQAFVIVDIPCCTAPLKEKTSFTDKASITKFGDGKFYCLHCLGISCEKFEKHRAKARKQFHAEELYNALDKLVKRLEETKAAIIYPVEIEEARKALKVSTAITVKEEIERSKKEEEKPSSYTPEERKICRANRLVDCDKCHSREEYQKDITKGLKE